MYSEWVADHMVSVFWITDDLRSDLSWEGDEWRKETEMEELWQCWSSNIHANKTNWDKLKRVRGTGRRGRKKTQKEIRVRAESMDRKRREDRPGSQASCYTAVYLKTKRLSSLLKYNKKKTKNKIQYLLDRHSHGSRKRCQSMSLPEGKPKENYWMDFHQTWMEGGCQE